MLSHFSVLRRLPRKFLYLHIANLTSLLSIHCKVSLIADGLNFPGFIGKELLINARSESVLEKRIFQESVRHRRCVIPAKGFYEWNVKKEKYQFERLDQEAVLFMAGCFQRFQEQEWFVILTTQANASVSPVHHRMPLVLEKNEIEN